MPYIEEIPSGTPIQPLPTAVTGLVGACGQGPVDTPVTVTSAAEYHAIFGPSLGADQPLGHAVDLFFANAGTSAIVVRAQGPAPEQLVPVDGAAGLRALEVTGVTLHAIPGQTAAAEVAQLRIHTTSVMSATAPTVVTRMVSRARVGERS